MRLIVLLLVLFTSNDPRDISKANSLKKMAEKAYQQQDYQMAAAHYSMLIDTLQYKDNRAMLNMGHAYLHAGDTTHAAQSYQKLAMADDAKLQSIAYQQLGVINQKPSDLPKALQYFKQAIKSDPTNEEARFNYELVKKKLDQQKDQNKDDQNNDKKDKEKEDDKKEQEKKDQQDKDKDKDNKDDKNDQDKQDQDEKKEDEKGDPKEDQKDQKDKKEGDKDEKKEGKEEPKDEKPENANEDKDKEAPQPSTSEKLQEMNLSEEKAKMILEAMRNSEIQYLQQMKKKPTKSPDSKKPDW